MPCAARFKQQRVPPGPPNPLIGTRQAGTELPAATLGCVAPPIDCGRERLPLGGQMLDWVRENHATLSVLVNIGMLIVWVAYLQLFLASFRRQTRPKILINIGAGRSLDARCLVANMSSDAVYVESLIATVFTEHERWVCPVTDVRDLAEDDGSSDPRDLTRQGPLQPGAVMDVGSFRDLVGRVVAESGHGTEAGDGFPDGLRSLDIQVVADFGPDDLLVGAKREFELVERDGRLNLGAHSRHTRQIRSRRERRRIKRMLEEVEP